MGDGTAVGDGGGGGAAEGADDGAGAGWGAGVAAGAARVGATEDGAGDGAGAARLTVGRLAVVVASACTTAQATRPQNVTRGGGAAARCDIRNAPDPAARISPAAAPPATSKPRRRSRVRRGGILGSGAVAGGGSAPLLDDPVDMCAPSAPPGMCVPFRTAKDYQTAVRLTVVILAI